MIICPSFKKDWSIRERKGMVTKIYQIKKYITRRAVEHIEHTATLIKKTIYSEAE